MPTYYSNVNLGSIGQNVLPKTTGTYNLGSGTYRWLGVNGTTGSFSSYLTTGGYIGTDSFIRFISQFQRQMTNGSGGSIPEGSVVVLDTGEDAGSHYDTTTTAGDEKVIGVALSTVGSGSASQIITYGQVANLRVNGVTDIAVGDFLQTHTDAGVSQKGTVGSSKCFAIALEGYTTDDSNGSIKAFIFGGMR